MNGVSAEFTKLNALIDDGWFPIAVWLQDPKNAEEYKSIGINTYVGLWRGPTDEQMSLLRNAGMKLICGHGKASHKYIDDDMIIAWMHGDEPDNAQSDGKGGWGPPIDPAKIINDYKKIRETDPTRPVYLNLGKGVADHDWVGRGVDTGKTDMYPKYIMGSDIVSYDIYPVNDGHELSYVAKGIDNLQKWSDYKKPAWCWIEASNFNDTAQPTPEQIKAEVWMALIHGARGFGYFCHKFKPYSDDAYPLHDEIIKKGIAAINAEITSLSRVLNSKTTTRYAEVTSTNGIPVDIMTKKYDSENYVFAVAMKDGNTSAEFKIADGSKVEVIGENRVIEISGGKFSESFSSHAVHLYKISK